MPSLPKTPLDGYEITPKMNDTWEALDSLVYPPSDGPIPPRSAPPVATRLELVIEEDG